MSTVARELGCDWHTAEKYVLRWEATRLAWADEKEKMLDMAEGVLYKNIRAGDSNDAKWVLSKLGKHRGFGDKLDVEHSGELGVVQIYIPDNGRE